MWSIVVDRRNPMVSKGMARMAARSLSVIPSMGVMNRCSASRVMHHHQSEGLNLLRSNWKPSVHSVINNQMPLAQSHQLRHFSQGPPNGMNLGNIFNNGQKPKPGETLAQYGIDLTALAKEAKLDPVIGRHEEIRRTLQILARRTKNNPVLIGEYKLLRLE
jgi:ATP-dependent Clp protease ATP-binding subunit ClpA